jgi:hypothetical protein
MSDVSQDRGWWQATEGKWSAPGAMAGSPVDDQAADAAAGRYTG